MNKILVTGCAGFIGSSLVDQLIAKGFDVSGVDNFNDYYDPKLKTSNLKNALMKKNFRLYKEDILNFENLKKIFNLEKPEIVTHLAATAGVRPSIENPKFYAQVNVLGTVNLLRLSVDLKVKKFIYASSSSVYGNSKRVPFREDDPCNTIISPYGASKRAGEFFVESFHKSLGLNSVILRFFTVYGPRGRIDMAPALFSKAIINGEKLKQFGNGTSSRDYTYIDDITDGILKAIEADIGFEIINLGNNSPISLLQFISTLEKILKKKAKITKLPVQSGDVQKTWANIVKAIKILNWHPRVSLEKGIKRYLAGVHIKTS